MTSVELAFGDLRLLPVALMARISAEIGT